LTFVFIAQDDTGSARVYEKIREDVNRTKFFNPYKRPGGSTREMAFVSEADRFKRDITPTIRVGSFPCTEKAARGPSSLFLVLDEFAHFRSEVGSTSDAVYAAAKPSTSFFIPQFGPNVGQREAMVIEISSPWKRVGKMYELHTLALSEDAASEIFTIRLSTAEMNPRMDSSFLRQEYKTNSMTWKAEYGGEFLDSSESYVKEAQLKLVVDEERENITRFTQEAIGRQYFWCLDIGIENDATALGIGHLEYRPKSGIELIYDYIDRMMVGEEFFGIGVTPNELGGLKKYQDYKELPLEDVVKWLVAMHEVLPCFKGFTDQFGGSMCVQLLKMAGITNLEKLHVTGAINSKAFYALKGYIDHQRCRFPNQPKFLNEIKQVEANLVSKYILKVEAPAEKGAHDDMVDVAAGVAYLAQEYLDNEGKSMLDSTGIAFAVLEQMSKPPAPIADINGVSMAELQIRDRMQRMNIHMGSPVVGPIQNPFFTRRRK
jgi:hypothetical protein